MSESPAVLAASIKAARSRRLEDELGGSVVTTATSKTSPAATEEEEGGGGCGGFTNSEWFYLLISIPGPIVMLVLTFKYWFDCPPIPSMAYNVPLAAIFELALALAEFGWHVEKLRESGDARQNDGYLNSPTLVVHDFLASIVVSIAIWGAVLTYGRWDVYGTGEGQCHPGLYLPAFISSVITLLFVLYYLGESCWENVFEDDNDDDDNDDNARNARTPAKPAGSGEFDLHNVESGKKTEE